MVDKMTYFRLRRAISERSWAAVDKILLEHELGPNDRRPHECFVRDFGGIPLIPDCAGCKEVFKQAQP